MKKKNFYFLITCVIFIMNGCSNDELPHEQNATEVSSDLFTFSYKSESYSSKFVMDEEGNITLLNKEMNVFMNNLKQKNDISIVYQYDGSIDFYDSAIEARKRLEEGTLFKENPLTRATTYYKITGSKLEIYVNANYGNFIQAYSGSVSVASFNRTPVPGSLKSFKFSGTFQASDDLGYPGTKRSAQAAFFEKTDYQGRSFWHKIDNNKKENNSSNTPFSVQSFQVTHNN